MRGRHDPHADIFQLVHDWLQDEGKGPWVIILDNVDDSAFLKLLRPNNEGTATTPRKLISYIPRIQHGSVLVTSRSKGAALELVEQADMIVIEPMGMKAAFQLFQNKLGQNEDEACTLKLAASLEYMPLAIVQAAAYIVQRRPRCSVQKYMDEFSKSDKRKTNLLRVTGGDHRRDPEAENSILLTWQISFEYIRETRPSAADLLSLMSFCDRQGIPQFLLRGQDDSTSSDGSDGSDSDEEIQHHGTNNLDLVNDYSEDADMDESIDSERSSDSDGDWKEWQSNYTDDDSFESDIVTLRNYDFISVNEDGATFEMHRLVQLATITWLKAKGIYKQQSHRFLKRLCTELPTGEYENWPKWQVLYPHVQWATSQPQPGKESMEEWATILFKASVYAIYKEKETVVDLSIRTMEAMRQVYGEEHGNVVGSKLLVTTAYMLRGHWDEAEKLAVEVMEISRRTLGEDHPDTLTRMSSLASAYLSQGRLGEAERLQIQVMEKSKIRLGEDHPITLTSMNDLASTYNNQGRLREAERLCRQLIERNKTMLGADHPDTLTSMNNLAFIYGKQGRLGEAERLHVQIMEKSKKRLGEDHPETLNSMNNLAVTRLGQGRLEEAEYLQLQVMEKMKTKFGQDHPSTQLSMSILMLTYTLRGQLEKAKRLEEQLLESYKITLRDNHPDTLASMAGLAHAYRKQGRLEETERLCVQLLEKRKTTFGESHPDTLNSMHNLAFTLGELGRSPEALDLLSCCISLRQRVLGPEHSDTQDSVKMMEELQSKMDSAVSEDRS